MSRVPSAPSDTSPAMPYALPLCTWPCPRVPCGCPTAHPVPPLLQQGEELVEELVGQGRAFLAQLRAELDLSTPLEATEPRQAPGELAGTPTPSREPWDLGGAGADGAAGCPSTGRLHAWAVPTGCVPTRAFTPLSVAGSVPREKRELVPTELPGVEEEEEEEAGTGRGKCPAAPGRCGMPCATMGVAASPALASHPGPRAGCPMSVGQPSAIHPSTGTLCPCSPSVPRAWVLLPGAGSSMVPLTAPLMSPIHLSLAGPWGCSLPWPQRVGSAGGCSAGAVRLGAAGARAGPGHDLPGGECLIQLLRAPHPGSQVVPSPSPSLSRCVPGSPGTRGVVISSQILVDLGSKNAKGLYRAQVRATVGGRPTAFTGLVGLESDSLARSMPGLVALALEALKT